MIQRIHDKYILRQFTKILVISLLTFSIIYITVDLFEELDNFIDKKADLLHVFLYYLYSLPYILTYMTPVSLLLATIFSMGLLSRRNELTALISSGVSLWRISAPIIFTAVIICAGLIVFNETVVARANREKQDVMHYEIEGRKRENPMIKDNLHYLGEGGVVFLARRYDHSSKILFDVVLQKFDNNTLVRRIDAKRAFWRGNKWVFYDGFDRTFAADSESVKAFHSLAVENLQETPDDFVKEQVEEENMNYSELLAFIKRVRRSGGDVEQYMVDLYFRFSFPLAGAIFVLIGLCFTTGKRKQSVATGFGATLLISFLYYGVLRMSKTLGQNGVLPPLLAAQMGNIIFLAVGIVFLHRANR